MAAVQGSSTRRVLMHTLRVGMFATVILLIHLAHRDRQRAAALRSQKPLRQIDVTRVFPAAATLGEPGPGSSQRVTDSNGDSLGYVLQTSPISDDLIGFSGPTNVLIGFDDEDRIVDLAILNSGDTRDHVRQVEQAENFWQAFRGKTWDETAAGIEVDAVSGATLTSMAIAEGIIARLGGQPPAGSLRFPDPLTLDQAKLIFENAAAIKQDDNHHALWQVVDSQGKPQGEILITTPAAEQIIGYQGPTQALVGFDSGGRVVGVAIGKTYDNEDGYVEYVRDDDYFLSLFDEMMIADLAKLDVVEDQIEGVSGVTMTSMAVAESLIAAAQQHQEDMQTVAEAAASPAARRERSGRINWSARDMGTTLVIVLALTIGLTKLRGVRWLRWGFLLVLIVYLGLINGDMLSQAMVVGWAQNGVPWRNAVGLVLLTAAAFVVPLLTRHNVYCSHICPHGAAQQLLKNRLPWQLHLPTWATRWLKILPWLLLAWCVVVAVMGLAYSLVDIEPFDAWVFRIAGWATISVAIVGLVASLFVPMAYCRFGCPTGALLGYLRFNAKSHEFGRRDWAAAVLMLLALSLWFFNGT